MVSYLISPSPKIGQTVQSSLVRMAGSQYQEGIFKTTLHLMHTASSLTRIFLNYFCADRVDKGRGRKTPTPGQNIANSMEYV